NARIVDGSNSRDHQRRQHRVAAKGKKIVLYADSFYPQHLLPNIGEYPLRRCPRRHVLVRPVRGLRGAIGTIEAKLRGQTDSLQLSGWSFGKFVEKDDAVRHLVVSDQLRGVIPDLDLGRHVSRPKYYGGGNLLAEAMVWKRKCDCLRDRGMST